MEDGEISTQSTESYSVSITRCPICLEILKKPKYLPCLHTFCECCLLTYIESKTSNPITEKCLSCPTCKVDVAISELSAKEFCEKLPVNFLLLGLIEQHKVQRPERLCMSCERLNEKTEATHVCIDCIDALCDICLKHHMSNKLTAMHNTITIGDFSENEAYQSSKFFYYCEQHRNKEIELFCVDHDTPCCSICLSVKHRQCNNIMSIEDAAKAFSESKTIKSLKTGLTGSTADTVLLKEHNEKLLKSLETQLSTTLEKIDEFKANLTEKIGCLLQLRRDELYKHYHAQKDIIERNIIQTENNLKNSQLQTEILNICLNRENNVHLLHEAKKLGQKLLAHESYLCNASTVCKDFNLDFTQDVDKIMVEIDKYCRVHCHERRCGLILSRYGGDKTVQNIRNLVSNYGFILERTQNTILRTI